MSPEIIHYITKYGYAAIFALIFLQEVGVPDPVPNELVLMFSGYLSFKRILSLPVIIVIALLADFTGTSILYAMFFFFGKILIKHKPKWIPISNEMIEKMSEKVTKGGIKTIYMGRLTPFLRGYASVIPGLLHVKPQKFLPVALISSITWAGFYLSVGRLLGPYWAKVSGYLKYALIAILLIFIIIGITRYIQKKSANKTAEDTV